ncbi:Cdc6-like AAA superfamily ATPase [Flavobacterium sp. CG_23.5]|uniref:McrB family protein n=1 Tax=Flavobacterium sp. CG_23.5 TaxID=2760708 RepID=UPI001EBD0119|nr:AAA family ATPase [Flavobacterium sp. CG_23.5]MBP2281694.1 Cdc6-like AAA superfamily ATPase [Flavobacterium sp. CG_23.5]
MKYWMLSPNVKNGENESEWKNAIQELGYAFIGYNDDHKFGELFKNGIQIGDIILLAQGQNSNKAPYLCGVVSSGAKWEHLIKTPSIAQNRKLKNCISRKELDKLGLDFIDSTWGESKQPATLYALKPNENSKDLGIVNKLQNAICNKRMETLMDNIKLSPERQSEIKNMWIKFKDKFTDKDKTEINDEAIKLATEWQQYRSKIEDGSLNLDEYTNRKDADTAIMPGSYMCNFLERDTKSVFGSSKPGNSNNFEIKLNSDELTYTIRRELKATDKGFNKYEKDKSLSFFTENVIPILEKIVKTHDSREKVDAVENSNYAAKQILRKMAVLDKKGDFLFIYSNSIIDILHAEFVESAEATNLGKNHEIRLVANEILALDKDNVVESVLLSWFLWRYANTQSIADENTPNVILYGPPGTGKTYAVKQSLDFICQGDRSRYEFVQFHPSFTYEDFIEGIKPKGVTPDGNIKFELVDGIFKRFCKKAKANPSKKFYFVVDEINRANLSSVFGETLLCLEKDYRHDVQNKNDENLIKTQYSTLIEEMVKEDPSREELAYHFQEGNAYFGVPNNVFFIGMMNDVDKSIDAFDLALRRRFKWIRKDCDYEVIEETKFKNGEDFTNIDTYVKACQKLNDYINIQLGLGKSYEFGHSFFMKMTAMASRKEISIKNLESLFQLHLSPTLKEYLRAMFAESELDDKLQNALEEFTKPFKGKV